LTMAYDVKELNPQPNWSSAKLFKINASFAFSQSFFVLFFRTLCNYFFAMTLVETNMGSKDYKHRNNEKEISVTNYMFYVNPADM